MVVPVVHSAAALRAPERYQEQLTRDLRAVADIRAAVAAVSADAHASDRATGDAVHHPAPVHRTAPLAPFVIGLAEFGREGLRLGLDSEGSAAVPECVSLAHDTRHAACIETIPTTVVHVRDSCDVNIMRPSKWGNPFVIGKDGTREEVIDKHAEWIVTQPQLIKDLPELQGRRIGCCCHPLPCHGDTLARLAGPATPKFLRSSIEHASRLVIHHAKSDLKVLHRLAITPPAAVDCTMLKAYHLGEPQSLKVLAYRLCGYEMGDYLDLVTPLDNARVRATLQEAYDHLSTAAPDQSVQHPLRARSVRAGRETRARGECGESPAAGAAAAPGNTKRHAKTINGGVPSRIVTSLRNLLKEAGPRHEDGDGEQSGAEGDSSVQSKTLRARWSRSVFAPHIPLPPPTTWRDAPADRRIPYAMGDAVAHLAVDDVLTPRLRTEGVMAAYRIDKGVLPFLVRNEIVGLAVDAGVLRSLSTEFAADYDRVCRRISRLAGHELNPASWPQVGETLFDELEITPTKRTATGGWTTADKYLKARKGEHAIVPLILEARQISKMRGTYVDKLPAMLVDGRYHPDWKYTRTISGRPAEEIILLIPKHSDRGRQIRHAFHHSRGGLVSCDLSQIELRVFAHESRDEKMIAAYMRGEDFHAKTAHELLGAPKNKENQDESLHRLPSKTLNFAVIMGTTEYGLLDQFLEQGIPGWDLERCREFLRGWFQVYRGGYLFIERKKAEARRDGYVRDMWGAKIRLSGIWVHHDDAGRNDRIRAEYERRAHAVPIQAGAIRIAKRWLARVYDQVIKPTLGTRSAIEPWVWMHDDVTVDGPRSQRHAIAARICELVPQDLCVPVTADGKAGRTWGDLSEKGKAESLIHAA